MTIKHVRTPQEKTYDQLLGEEWEHLSKAARIVFDKAEGSAYQSLFVHPDSYTSEQYDSDMRALRRAADEITEDDLEGLAKIWRSALAAAASIDPYDHETPVAGGAYPAHLYLFYRLLSSSVEEIENGERWVMDRKKRLSEQGPTVNEDPPSSANIATKKPNRNLRLIR